MPCMTTMSMTAPTSSGPASSLATSSTALPAARDCALFYAKVKHGAGVHSLLTTLELVAKEYSETCVCLEVIRGKGLQVRAIDPAKCSFVDSFFPSTSSIFNRFDCAQDYLPIWVHPSQLSKAIKTSTNSTGRSAPQCLLHLRVERAQPDVLHITVECATSSGITKSTRHQLAMLQPVSGDDAQVFVDGNEFRFAAECYMESPEMLSEVLQDLKSSECDQVAITISQKAIQFSGSSKGSCTAVDVSLQQRSCAAGKMVLRAPSDDGPVTASFACKHLLKLLNLCKQSGQVLLQLGAEAPLSAVFSLPAGGTVQIFMAPSLEDEDLI